MIKKIVIVLLVLSLTFCTFGCGDTKYIEGTEYDTYGFINESEKKNPDIKYNMIIGNVVWSVLLVETLIAPIYFFGFSLYEPVRAKNDVEPIGSM